jgi:NitT/TauT family transport system substrate-binding protein
MTMIANAVRNLGALALVSAAVTMSLSNASAQPALKAKVGVLRLSSSAPVFIAQDKGYFKDAGLDIELKFFDAAQPIAVAVTSGDVDFGVTAFTAGLYNLAGKGTLKVIGGMSREKAGYPLIGYFASNGAHAAGLKTPKDLAGKRIAVTQVGSSFHYSLGLLADKYGFKRRESAAAAVAVECRRRAERRNGGRRAAAGLHRAHADGCRRGKTAGLGRR